MKERRKTESDIPWWLNKEPNFARLQMAVCRGAFIFGRDCVKRIENFKQKEGTKNEGNLRD
jgi:hypothetical protein